MSAEDKLNILAETIAAHARKMAHKEWENEYREALANILSNAKVSDVLSVDGRPIPVESLIKAIREEFLRNRTQQLMQGLTEKIVQGAFRQIIDEEEKS